MALKLIFWISVFSIVYSYLLYSVLLFIFVFIKRLFKTKQHFISRDDYPNVTLFVAAYNEEDFVDDKMADFKKLDYPADKMNIVWVTDGSDDKTVDKLKKYEGVSVYHENERKGKIGAINRGMKLVQNSIVIFSDCNTRLNPTSIKEITALFSDTKVGCVAGEKRISKSKTDAAVNSGEGFYWRYESRIKKMESELSSTVGAAGELFAIRSELFTDAPPDTLLDDFVISLTIAMKGYKIAYAPKAFAEEAASISVKEELKRKVRIACGGIQTMVRYPGLFNIFKRPLLTFQYFSHKVLRWTLVPFAFFIAFVMNVLIVANEPDNLLFLCLMAGQVLFYALVLIGGMLHNSRLKFRLLFVPYYIIVMNWAIILGYKRYLFHNQSVNWEKAKRSK